jgi:aspartyl-tRNA(Asn)/glutamyl-tRNA(Gln) amidotransferase subunit A
VAFGSSLDCVSVFGQTVVEAARVLSVISGHDTNDATSVEESPMDVPPCPSSLEGVTVGLPREYLPPDLDPGVRAGIDKAVEALRGLGATVVEVSLPHTKYAVPTYYIIAPAEASANLARYDGVRFGLNLSDEVSDLRGLYRTTRGTGFGPEVRRRILIGTYVLSAGYYEAYYGKAQRIRAHIAKDFTTVFEGGVDVLFTPTTPTTAFRAGEKTGDPVAMYLADIFTCPANLAGIPGVSLPIGRCDGLPIGGQLLAPYFQEVSMLGVAGALEAVIDPVAEIR